MRSIVTHKCVGLNESLALNAVGQVTSGGANDCYEIHFGDQRVQLKFQNGSPNLVGVNGISNECLLAIVADRLEGFQAGAYQCRENALALTKIQEALHWLQHRERSKVVLGCSAQHC